MRHSRITTAAAILGLLLVATAHRRSAATNADPKDSLKGLTGVYLIVEYLRPEAEKAGVTRAQLVTDTELRLRQSGIRLLTEAEWLKTPAAPCLYVNVDAKPKGTLFTYSVDVDLKQVVELGRDPAVTLLAATCSTGLVGRTDSAGVRQALRGQLDLFATGFLSANPRQLSHPQAPTWAGRTAALNARTPERPNA